jgi:hypothetical protein
VDVIRDFTVLIDDDRYKVPNLRFVVAKNEACAAHIADGILAESPHHQCVEVWTDDAMVYAAGLILTQHSNGNRPLA